MKLQMHSIKFDADQKLLDFVQKKMDKLEQYYDRIVDGEIIMRLENDDSRANKIVEAKINMPGEQLFAKMKSKSFEAATDEAVEALRKQVQKFKERQTAH